MALSFLNSQLPSLIEKFEPDIEKALRNTLRSIKISNPSEATLFYTNWKKLNMAIEEELGPSALPAVVPPPVDTTPPVAPVTTGGNLDSSVPSSEPMTPFVTEPAPADIPVPTETGPTGPVGVPPSPEASGPSFAQETGATGPSIIQRITEFISPKTDATGGKKNRKRKTAKQHKKRTHRVKHRKH
jgi:hypothetical protein